MGSVISIVLATFAFILTIAASAQTVPPTIAPEAQLTPPAGRRALAIDIHRNIVVMGSDAGPPSGINGVAQVYRRAGGTWALQQTLTRPHAFPGDRFGTAIEWDGRTLVIGSPGNPSGSDGAIVIYEPVNGAFVWRQTIDVPAGEPNFGLRVSLNRGRMAVSATIGFSTTNAVYLFKRDSSGLWVQEAHLVPPQEDEDQFGIAIDLRGRRLIAGADQSTGRYALIYKEADGQWQQEARLDTPAVLSSFGRGVEIRRNRAWVGDPRSRAFHEYLRGSGTWSLTSTTSNPNDAFFAGALHLLGRNNMFATAQQAVYLYSPDSAGGWSQRAVFQVPDALAHSQEEESMDAQGRWLAALFADSGYIFDASSVVTR